MALALVDADYLSNTLTDIASTIRMKNRESGSMVFPEDFISGLNRIPNEGPFSYDDICGAAFSGVIQGSTSVIGEYAFAYCGSISKASFSNCTSINRAAFVSNFALREISFPLCVIIRATAFFGCSSLSTASFPACTAIYNGAFGNCTNLQEAIFPVCQTTSDAAFESCQSLQNIEFPACTYIGSGTFEKCTSLSIASFPACTAIGAFAFDGCSALQSIYLLGNSVPVLGNSYVFKSTPIENGLGKIYVRSSMYEAFCTASGWSKYASIITSYVSV